MQFPGLSFTDENLVPTSNLKHKLSKVQPSRSPNLLSGILSVSPNVANAQNFRSTQKFQPAYIPGKWFKELSFATKLPDIEGVPPQVANVLSDESDEFFEATEAGSVPLVDYRQFQGVEPHMSQPLLPDGSPLDLSPLRHQKWKTNVSNSFPFAGNSGFQNYDNNDECSLMHIMNHEVELLDAEENGRSLWGSLKAIAFGLNAQEYEEEFPWDKFVQFDESDDSVVEAGQV